MPVVALDHLAVPPTPTGSPGRDKWFQDLWEDFQGRTCYLGDTQKNWLDWIDGQAWFLMAQAVEYYMEAVQSDSEWYTACDHAIEVIEGFRFAEVYGAPDVDARLAELQSMPYADYLSSPEWLVARDSAKRRAGYRCQVCNSKGPLHVHHRTYARRGKEQASDLTVLCADCHGGFHERRRLVRD